MMLIANKENFRCKPTNTDITRSLDSYYRTFYSSKHHYINMSRKATASITIRKPVHILMIPMAFLNMANLPMVNVSALDFHVWQHLKDNRNETQPQHLTTIPLILVNKIYQHIINGTQHIIPFDTTDKLTEDTNLIWTLFLDTGMYVTSIGLLIPAGLGMFPCHFFWC